MKKWFSRIKIRLVSISAWMSGLSVFIPLGTLALVAAFVVDPKKLDPFIKACSRLLIRMLFIRVSVTGREKISADSTYIFISNHVNIFDPFVLYGYIPNYLRGVELEDHFSWPLYGQLITRLGNIPINRKNPRLALQSLERARRAAAGGTSIVILPEGGRTLDGRFKPFKRGAFLLTQKAGVDIVPVVMTGAYKIKHKGSLLIRPGRMELRFGTPVPYRDVKDMDVKKLRSHVRGLMESMIKSK